MGGRIEILTLSAFALPTRFPRGGSRGQVAAQRATRLTSGSDKVVLAKRPSATSGD